MCSSDPMSVLRLALQLTFLCGLAASVQIAEGGDDDINSLLAAYKEAYTDSVSSADVETNQAIHAANSDWEADTADLPGSAQSKVISALDDGPEETADEKEAAGELEDAEKEVLKDQGETDALSADNQAELGESDDELGESNEDAGAEPDVAVEAPHEAWRSHLEALNSQVESNPQTWVSLAELNSYYLESQMGEKHLTQLSEWLQKNNMPTKTEHGPEAANKDLGEGASVAPHPFAEEYRIADLQYAVMTLFN